MRNTYLVLIIAWIILLTGCAQKEKVESKSLEQIFKEDGVPVKIEKVTENYFGKTLQYSGRLTSVNQGTEQAMVGGKVDSILYSVGDYVEEGEIVLTFPEDLTGMNYQAVKANYDVMLSSYERLQNLYKEGGISQQDVDNVKAGYLAAESQLATADQMLKVTAPNSGYITAIYVQETDHLEAGDLLFTVSEPGKLKTEIAVTEKEINLFQKGIKAIAKWEDIEYVGFSISRGGFTINCESFNSRGKFEDCTIYHNIRIEDVKVLEMSNDELDYYIAGIINVELVNLLTNGTTRP